MNSTVDARNKGNFLGESLTIFKSVCYQFILECPNPGLPLSTVKVALEDFTPTVSNKSQVFTVREKGNKGGRISFERNLDEIICSRCWLPGLFVSASSGFAWTAFSVALPGSLKYLLDSCLNTHISTHKVQFEEFKIISGKIFGIAKDALDVKGIGRVKLVYPVSGY